MELKLSCTSCSSSKIFVLVPLEKQKSFTEFTYTILNNYCNLLFVVSEAVELQIAITWFVMFCPMALSKCPLLGAGPSGGILHVQHQWSREFAGENLWI
jgi:hypothetical protein